MSIQAESLRIADARFRNGATSELDVSQARALLESTRASIPQLEISLAQSKNALTTLLGQPPGSLQNVLQGPQAIPTAPAQVAVSIPAEVLRRRPDIRNAELVAMAQCERIGVAKADLYPHFLLSGTLGLNATQGGAQSFNLFSPASFFFAVGPQVTWQFLNYGRIKNQVRVEDARFQEVVTTYQNSVLSASQEVEDGIIGFVKELEATSVQQEAVTAARRSAALALIQYREGAVDYQRVLLADQTLLQQENNLISLRSGVATNTISLYKALGGGWEMSIGQPFVPDAIRDRNAEAHQLGQFVLDAAEDGLAHNISATTYGATIEEVRRNAQQIFQEVDRHPDRPRGRRRPGLQILEVNAVGAPRGDRVRQRPYRSQALRRLR